MFAYVSRGNSRIPEISVPALYLDDSCARIVSNGTAKLIVQSVGRMIISSLWLIEAINLFSR
jgi:hypothetical protein